MTKILMIYITALLGRRPRTKTAAQIIAELDHIYALGWRGSIFFVDDNFIGNKRQLKDEVLPALIAWRQGKSGLRFSTELSINLADDEELMTMMVDAGFTTVFVGIETPDDDSLAECSKFQNRGRDLVESVRRMQRAGMQVQGGFIVGFDSDTPSIFQRQIEFIQQSGIVSAMVGLLQALPGTQLYARLKNEAAEKYFTGNAQTLKRLEAMENSLREISKIVLTEHGISPTLLLGSLPVSVSSEKAR
jgi:radical SAM superfamily enzyme YgiQ (UPF0313 family)